MSPLNRGLLIACGVQLALAAVTNWPSGKASEPKDLVGISADEIQTITVTGRQARNEPPGASVTLTHGDAGWVIDSSEGYPASDALVQPLLDNLGKVKVTTAIATSAPSQGNLEVAPDLYTRKVEITSKSGEKKTLFFGSGESKSTAVRVDGEDDVYEVTGFTAWSLAENANRYFERDLYKIEPSEVSTVTLQRPGQPLVTLTQADGAWAMTPNPSGKPLDANATNGFVRGLVNLRMVDPHGKTVTPDMQLDGPGATRVSWTVTSGDPPQTNTVTYQVGGLVSGKTDRYYVKTDANPFVFEVLKGNVASAIEKPLDTVFGGPAAAPPPPAFGR